MTTDGEEGRSRGADPLLVDDLFWLEHARTLVTESAGLIRAQAGRLGAATAWLWSVYSGTVLAVVALDGLRDRPRFALVLLVVPVVALAAAYVLAVQAQGPVFGRVDPRQPTDVAEFYEHHITVARRWLKGALVAVVVAAFSVALGAVLAFIG